MPSPAHPMWRTLQTYQSLSAALTDAQQNLTAAEQAAKADCAPSGYDTAYEVWRQDVVAVIEELTVGLDKLETARREA